MLNYETFHKPRLRILAMTPGLAPGGAEVWLGTLIRQAQTVDYKGVITCGDAGQDMKPMLGAVPVWVTEENTYGAEYAEKMAIRAIKEIDGVDLILYWGFDPMPQLNQVGIPIVQVSHSSGMEQSTNWHREHIKRWGRSRANLMAAVSESAAELFDPELRTKDAVTIIHNGSDIERTRPSVGRQEQRKRWGLVGEEGQPEAKVLLYIGRFSPEKNTDEILGAMHYLPDDWHVVFYGWGIHENRLKDKARRMLPKSPCGSVGRVLFPRPRTSGLGDLYAAADVVVLASSSEAFPLVLIEAWQAGVPVVCSEFHTLLDIEKIYSEGRPLAWHVDCPPTDKQIAEAVLLTDPNAERVDEAARIGYTHFSASAMVSRWESYFYKCVSEWHTISNKGHVQIMQLRE